MENSFYDLDYIIAMGEKRVDLYLSAYQNILGRITNIILVYTAIGIYLIPIVQDLIDGAEVSYIVAAVLFLGLTIVSVGFTVRLLLPVRVAYLEDSNRYSTDLRQQYEVRYLNKEMNEVQTQAAKELINKYLKASYIDELSQAQLVNQTVSESKGSFYYRALVCALMAVIPYVVCIGFHLSRKDEKTQKVHLVYQKKIVNCVSTSDLYV
jgi:hypothetical protein